MTITEALAEIKTVMKRIDAKRAFVKQYLVRVDNVKDPLEKDGGSEKAVAEALQAIKDLEQRVVDLRIGIAGANEINTITIDGTEKSIADWLVWRREVLPTKKQFLANLNRTVVQARDQVHQWRPGNIQGGQDTKIDVVVNLNETQLSKDIEFLGKVEDELDGQLSLKNATVQVEI